LKILVYKKSGCYSELGITLFAFVVQKTFLSERKIIVISYCRRCDHVSSLELVRGFQALRLV
jgi:hypothetical protein